MVIEFIVHVAKATLVKNVKHVLVDSMVNQQLKVKSVNHANVPAILTRRKKDRAILSLVNV